MCARDAGAEKRPVLHRQAGKGKAARGRLPASCPYFRRMSSKGISESMAPKRTPSTRAVCTTMLLW